MNFRYGPFQKVFLDLLECEGRIVRCIWDGGPQAIYFVHYIINGELKSAEFYDDEISVVEE